MNKFFFLNWMIVILFFKFIYMFFLFKIKEGLILNLLYMKSIEVVLYIIYIKINVDIMYDFL